ncbi:hypothetical protein [Streptomyces sp. cg40]|uniref:hypothetical protein n=1 Tax=Streptomyces sp. cg40 TaxID=3419764 RepID=UPI003D040FFC
MAYDPSGREEPERLVCSSFSDGPVPTLAEQLNPPALLLAEDDIVVCAGLLPQLEPDDSGAEYPYYVYDAFRTCGKLLADDWSGVTKGSRPVTRTFTDEKGFSVPQLHVLFGSTRSGRLALPIAQRTAKAAEGHGGFDVELVDLATTTLPRLDEPAHPCTGSAEFFSLCTNDLTHTVRGVSHGDVEALFPRVYLEKGNLGVSPFETIDREGIGPLVAVARPAARSAPTSSSASTTGTRSRSTSSTRQATATSPPRRSPSRWVA